MRLAASIATIIGVPYGLVLAYLAATAPASDGMWTILFLLFLLVAAVGIVGTYFFASVRN
jgi:hypothetical protein